MLRSPMKAAWITAENLEMEDRSACPESGCGGVVSSDDVFARAENALMVLSG